MGTFDDDRREWLEPDGLGGFASGTISGIRTRRYRRADSDCAHLGSGGRRGCARRRTRQRAPAAAPEPCRTNFMKSDSASREGWTSGLSPKNRQKLMMRGRQRRRIHMRPGAVIHEQRVVHVQLGDVHFEGIGVHVLPERPIVVHDPLHLYGAFQHTRRGDRFGRHRREPGLVELGGLVPIAPCPLPLGNRVLTGGQRQAIDVRDQVGGGKIDDALARANEIVRGLYPCCRDPACRSSPATTPTTSAPGLPSRPHSAC